MRASMVAIRISDQADPIGFREWLVGDVGKGVPPPQLEGVAEANAVSGDVAVAQRPLAFRGQTLEAEHVNSVLVDDST